MALYSHEFIEEYKGLVGFGMDRPTDEATVRAYLQMFSDDACMKEILPRMSDEDLEQIFNLISGVLKQYFEEDEYHRLFLKEEHG